MTGIKKHLTENWHAWGVITAAVVFGWTAGWRNLRAQVEEQGDAIVEVISDVAGLKRKVDRIECVVVAEAIDQDPVGRCGL